MDTEYSNREDLYAIFTPSPDLHATITLNSDGFKEITDFVDAYLLKHAVLLEPHEGLWVPCDLLRYIHKGHRPFSQRLSRFEQIADKVGHFLTLAPKDAAMATSKKRKLGTTFLSQIAAFVFIVSEESAEAELELPHMQVGGMLQDTKDPGAHALDAAAEQAQLLLEYPKGLQGVLEESDEPAGTSAPAEAPVENDAIPEVELSRFSSIIVNKEEYLYLHDLEKALKLRMDECLSTLCIKGEFPFDTTSTPIEDMLLPLGDSVMDTVKLIMVRRIMKDAKPNPM